MQILEPDGKFPGSSRGTGRGGEDMEGWKGNENRKVGMSGAHPESLGKNQGANRQCGCHCGNKDLSTTP